MEIHLVRVTTDDGQNRYWLAVAPDQDAAVQLVLDAVPEGWAASPSGLMAKDEFATVGLRSGEVREVNVKAGLS
ncbi:hypothetical protein CWO91_10320 [Bradyrhizobium genosp. SA-3]|uniref:hypothetical protein n=1 Tax=Bradyrhizobium genosp. SA-3 TaxID=508868 RepID=UPI00102A153A|nr:hypothetical protein [Bradyrhizobium genosp. SA-3]RZN11008.1 hypothetical protein CWO91_10320 [Bradyrhizobium genosp. SA-3]